jgi:hypothetical protein
MKFLFEYISRSQLSIVDGITVVYLCAAWADNASWLVLFGIFVFGWVADIVCGHLGTTTRKKANDK